MNSKVCRRNRLASGVQRTAYSIIALLLLSSLVHAKDLLPEDTVASKGSMVKESMPKEPIVIDGDKVEYFQDQKKAVGTGNVSIKYKDMVLTCDKITVYLDTREAIAEGNVKITQKGSFFTGEKINYNFDTKEAKIIDGYISSKPFYGKAGEVDKPAEKNKYDMKKGYITTCDLDKPHYRIQSKHVEFYPEDKVIAKHIFLFIGNVPVLYLPYYVQPLNETKSHVTVTAGEKDEWGYYALSALRMHLNDKNRADLLLDYRAARGIGIGLNDYYESQVGNGAAKFYYSHDYADYIRGAYERGGDMRPRYRWQWRHKWIMPEETGTIATVEFNRLSDTDVIKDFFYTEYEEIGDLPDNYVSVVTAKPAFTANLLARKRFGKFYEVIERLPEYTINVPTYNLVPNTPIYYTGSASAIYFNHTYNNSTNGLVDGQKDVGAGRLDTYNRLSYALRLFRSLNITPFAGMRETYYSRNKWGKTNFIRGVFDTGVDASIKFYRLFDVETNFLGLDIHKLRHIITPTASYYYTHQPTVDPANLNQFDGVDALATSNAANFAVESRFQTKRFVDGSLKSVDLVTFIISSPYVFRLKKGNLAFKNHTQKFQSVDMQLEVIPYPWMAGVAKMSVNTKNYAVSTESFDITGSYGDWNVGVGHSYDKSLQFDIANQLTTQVIYKINETWKVRAYDRFNIQKSFIEQEYTIYRDLHCWQMELTYRTTKIPHEVGLWITFTLKAFPDYPIGYKRTYSQPRFGASPSTRFDTWGSGEERLEPSERFISP